MQIILQEDIEKLGHRGDVVTVKPGYARNFLLPRKLAIEATSGNMKVLERIRTSLAKKTATELEAAQKQARAGLQSRQASGATCRADQDHRGIAGDDQGVPRRHRANQSQRRKRIVVLISSVSSFNGAQRAAPQYFLIFTSRP